MTKPRLTHPVPYAPFRRLLAWVLRRRLVALVDHDNEVNVRVECYDKDGNPFAWRYKGIKRGVHLREGGLTVGMSFVEYWYPLADFRKRSRAKGWA